MVLRLVFLGMDWVADGGHHGEGEHDERRVAVPSKPGAGFIVIESKPVLSGLEAAINVPAISLNVDQRFD